MTSFSSSDSRIDLRDVTDRYDELRGDLTEKHEEGAFASDFDDWIKNSRDNSDPIYASFPDDGTEVQESIEEFYKLGELLDELRGNGGDHQWEGHWYPLGLIRDSDFTDAMRELCEDIGDMPKGFPSYIEIDWDATARNLQIDYSSVEFDGVTYWYR